MESKQAGFFIIWETLCISKGGQKNISPQFDEPYQHYQNPIFAIPANHDGDPFPNDNEKSLEAFVRNFCSTSTDEILLQYRPFLTID